MRKTDLNAIYISERVQETLRPVSVSALTAVVAPMGYGKTTAVNWFLNQRRQTEAAVILRVNIYSDNRFIFWKSVQNAFAAAGLTALAGCEYPEDASSAAQLMDDLCAVLAGDTPCYLFLDDFHLLKDEKAAKFLCGLANRLPANIHLIVGKPEQLPAQGRDPPAGASPAPYWQGAAAAQPYRACPLRPPLRHGPDRGTGGKPSALL